jgi:hypothetical protein
MAPGFMGMPMPMPGASIAMGGGGMMMMPGMGGPMAMAGGPAAAGHGGALAAAKQWKVRHRQAAAGPATLDPLHSLALGGSRPWPFSSANLSSPAPNTPSPAASFAAVCWPDQLRPDRGSAAPLLRTIRHNIGARVAPH